MDRLGLALGRRISQRNVLGVADELAIRVCVGYCIRERFGLGAVLALHVGIAVFDTARLALDLGQRKPNVLAVAFGVVGLVRLGLGERKRERVCIGN